jgi:hypothetical protein
MLRQDVVDAAAAGKFRIVSVRSVDEAMEILTTRSAAEINQLVEARLTAFAEGARAFGGRPSVPAE